MNFYFILPSFKGFALKMVNLIVAIIYQNLRIRLGYAIMSIGGHIILFFNL